LTRLTIRIFVVVGVERSLRLASGLGDTWQKKKQDIIVQNVLRSFGFRAGGLNPPDYVA